MKMDVVYLAPGSPLIKRKLYIREALHVGNGRPGSFLQSLIERLGTISSVKEFPLRKIV